MAQHQVQPYDRMPFRLYRKVQLFRPAEAADHSIRVIDPVASYDDARSFRNATVIVNDRGYMYHYFHFVEILLALWAFEKQFMPDSGIGRILFTTPHWTNPRQHHIQRELLAVAYPDVRIDTPPTFQAETIDDVVLIDRDLAITAINKFLEPVQWIAGRWTGAFTDAVFSRIATTPRSPAATLAEGPRALYVRRPPTRRLSDALEEQLLARLPEMGMRIDVVDYAQLSWDEQIQTTAGYDAVIGVHGNGLTNLLWLPPHGGVLEIFPAGAHHYDYQLLAEARKLAYFGVEGQPDGFVYREFSRHGDAVGHGPENNDKEVTDLSWLAVAQFVDHVRERAAVAAGGMADAITLLAQGAKHPSGLVLL